MDGERVVRIEVRVSYGLWPGFGYFCVKIWPSKFIAEQLFLVDRDDRRHELRPYRVGMFNA